MKIYCDSSIREACIVVEGKQPLIVAYKEKQTNNSGEYNAVILALETALSLGSKQAEILTDSRLVVEQVYGNWACHKPHLEKLRKKVWGLLAQIPQATIKWIPREENLAGKVLG